MQLEEWFCRRTQNCVRAYTQLSILCGGKGYESEERTIELQVLGDELVLRSA